MGLLLLSLLSVTANFPSDNLADRVETSVQTAAKPFMSSGRMLAMSIGIVKDGRSFTYNFGTTQPGANLLPSRHSRYCIASISKTLPGFCSPKRLAKVGSLWMTTSANISKEAFQTLSSRVTPFAFGSC